jgi:hypothetical protein
MVMEPTGNRVEMSGIRIDRVSGEDRGELEITTTRWD